MCLDGVGVWKCLIIRIVSSLCVHSSGGVLVIVFVRCMGELVLLFVFWVCFG